MNQTVATPEFASAPVSASQSAEKVKAPGAFGADILALRSALMEGENALAKRKDIGELHKRIITALTTMSHGLSEAHATRAAQDRLQLVERLDAVESAINGMEGALRIELEPMLRGIVEEAAERAEARPRKLWSMSAVTIAAFLVGMTVGKNVAPDLENIYGRMSNTATVFFTR